MVEKVEHHARSNEPHGGVCNLRGDDINAGSNTARTGVSPEDQRRRVCQRVYGVEQSLQHMKGVKDAMVDLSSGIVTVIGDPADPPSPETLARRVKNQRFSIEEIEATRVGRSRADV